MIKNQIITSEELNNSNIKYAKSTKVLDGWDTGVKSTIIQSIVSDNDSINTYKLKKHDKLFIPFNKICCSTIRYYIDTLYDRSIIYDINITFSEDPSIDPCMIKYKNDKDGDNLITDIMFINWNDALSSEEFKSIATDNRHILSLNSAPIKEGDSSNIGKAMVDIYIKFIINTVSDDTCSIDVNLYSKLTENGKKFIHGEE